MRRSTGLPATPEYRDAAQQIRRQVESDFVNEIVFGIKPSLAVGVAARRYLGLDEQGRKQPGKGKDLPPYERRILALAVEEFGQRRINLVTAPEWMAWAERLNAGNVPATLLRFMSPIRAFLRWCAGGDRQWLTVPDFELPKQSRRRHPKRRRVADLTPELLVFLFDHAPIHLKAQLYVEWSTGHRVSSVLFGCRLCDLILAPERSQITFHDTKNGDTVHAHLHPEAAKVVAEYLEWRGRLHHREGPLFLTDRRRPYSIRGRERGWGGGNKSAFRSMIRRAVKGRRRAAAAARRAGDREAAACLWDDAKLLRQVTQHWLRHWFATWALALGMDLRAIAEQAGWRDYRSLQGYQHDVPATRRQAVNSLPIGGSSGTTSRAGGS